MTYKISFLDGNSLDRNPEKSILNQGVALKAKSRFMMIVKSRKIVETALKETSPIAVIFKTAKILKTIK